MTELVQLLGGARAKVGLEWVDFVPDMRYQLLAYLAYQQEWVSRERIAFLFWADTSTKRARQNLRQLLRRIRALSWLDGLEIDEHRARWLVPTDLLAFERGIEQEGVEETLRRHPGPLLPGLEGVEDNEFATWLALEREHLRAHRREIGLERAQALHSSGHHDRAEVLLDLLLTDASLDEEALVGFMHAALEAGHRRKALRRYEAFRKSLAQEMGLEPSAETRELARQLRAEGRATAEQPATAVVAATPERAGKRTTPAHRTPPKAATSFIGREVELAEIANRLADPDCRLLTLVGPGGTGKTRMAMRAAEELAGEFGAGVLFLQLEALPSGDMIPWRLAEGLDLTLHSNEDPTTRLAKAIGEDDLLLVLDNLEHLLDGVSVLSVLLGACPNLTVLATSRERLNLVEEWLLPVRGLAYPQDDFASLDEALSFDAVRLFIQRVERLRPSFGPTDDDLPRVLEICRLVEGSPLALELAATWVRLLSLEQIANEIDSNVDFLATRARNVPQRHQSVRVVFDHSWKLLTPTERTGLRKLAVFRGGFTRGAANAIAGASLPVLASLVDKSLLGVTPSGRYDVHPLLHQYLRENLAEHPAEEQEIRKKHTSYFLRFLFERKVALWETEQQAAIEAVEADFENIRAAWVQAVHHRQVGWLKQAAEPLNKYLSNRGYQQEARNLLQSALEVLDADHPDQRDTVVLLLALLAWKHVHMGLAKEAHELASSAWSLVGPQRDTEESIWALGALGGTALMRGDYPEAKRCWREFLVIARKQLVNRNQWVALNNLAFIELHVGNYDEAERLLHEALELSRNAESPTTIVNLLTNLGTAMRLQGHPEQAISLLREAVQLAEQIGFPHDLDPLAELGAIYCDLAQFERANEICQDVLRRSRRIQYPAIEVFTQTTLGRIAVGRNDVALAERHLLRGIDLAWGMQRPQGILNALSSLAEVRAVQDRNEQAANWASLIRHHQATEKHIADRAEALLGTLRGKLEANAFAAAVEHGAGLTLAEAVRDALQLPPAQQ